MTNFNRVLLAAAVSLCATAFAGNIPTIWDATVTINKIEIPFRFELTTRNGKTEGAFVNGDDRVRSSAGHWKGNGLTLAFDDYGATLTAKLEGGRLNGIYNRQAHAPAEFHAKPYRAPSPAAADEKIPSIAGDWVIQLSSKKGEPAWKFLVRQSGPEVSASILRIDGDSGELTGSYHDGKFTLSHFSGARPSLLEVTLNSGGTLALLQNGKARLTAVKSTEALAKGLPEPADPSRWTSVKDPSEPLRFSGVDLNSGAIVSESDARFRGKVVVVNITGSWCPNCHDEAPFLAELYKEYKSKGLEIVALSFEDAEQLKDPVQLRAFVRNYGIGYTVLVAGEPSQLNEKLPQAVNLNTFPATFFIGRDGLVRGSHAGYASKATGEEGIRTQAEFRKTIEKLLAENVSASSR
ncbi:MAG TPA: TlpA disulfide reductase family protein [Bryobacteraceae bacterium]|jgi:thiol-disulfide isomerase/thioredoxin